MEIYNWVANALIFSLPFGWYMCYKMYIDSEKKDKQIELYRRMKGIELGTTRIIEAEEQWFDGRTFKIDVVECCKIGPVTDQKYCSNCGKLIMRDEKSRQT